MKAKNPVLQVMVLDLSLLPLNQEQRKLYNMVVAQYSQELYLASLPLP
jgi:hypothetical protein